MSGWFVSGVLLPLLEWFIAKEEPAVLAWLKEQVDSVTQAQTDSKNVATLQQAVQSGTMSEVDQAAVAALNGNNPK